MLKWLRSEGCPWGARACAEAAKRGHWETLKWLRSEGCPWDYRACAKSARGGHLEVPSWVVLKWLRSEGCPWDECPWGEDHAHERSTQPRELNEQRDSTSTPQAVGVATESLRQAVLDQPQMPELPEEVWAKILESVSDESMLAFAMTCKQFRGVQEISGRNLQTELPDISGWARSLFNDQAYNYQAYNDRAHIKVNLWLDVRAEWFVWAWSQTKRKEYRVRQMLLKLAAYFGVVRFVAKCVPRYFDALQNKRDFYVEPFGKEICLCAAAGGHLDVLQHLHENGCPWDSETCHAAAAWGHLDMLKYAHENGCPWDGAACDEAAKHGDLDMLKYLHENGCPWDEETCAWAAAGSQLDVLKYARENGCPWNERTFEFAARIGQLDVLEYARENDCPWDETACAGATEVGKLDVLKWLRSEGCPWNREECLGEAFEGGHNEMAEWIRAQPATDNF